MENALTLPRLLAKKSYRSFQSGKWWEGHFSQGGFTSGMSHGDPERGGRHGDEGLSIGREGLEPIFHFIEETAGKPFFVWYAPFMPHTPHSPPQRLYDKYREVGRPVSLARYYAMCEWFDETVGELLNYLEQKGLAEDTLILFLADNGWLQRTPEMVVPSGWPFNFAPASKRSPYEAGIRTPILLRWPGKILPRRLDVAVSSIDVAPTILSAVGLNPPEQMNGLNLLEESGLLRRKTIYGAQFTHDVEDPANPLLGLKYRWCIQGHWKLIVPHAPVILDARVQLYDLACDPNETTNLAPQRPDVVLELYAEIQRWWKVE
jgi:uncharacterized sulfatase